MQSSYSKIIRNPLFIIILTSPIVLWGLIMLLPTFDDWTYLTTPDFGNCLSAERMLPNGSYWRPIDALFGSLLGLNYNLFPTLNHIVVYIGHLGCTIIVYKLIKTLKISHTSRNIATLYFYFTPAMLGTVLGIDSLNQVYSQFWGLLALLLYIEQPKRKYILWIVFTLIATLSKENGLVWTVIPPIIAFAFHIIERKELKKDLLIGIIVCIAYLAIRVILTNNQNDVNEEYLSAGLLGRIKYFATFIGLTWLPIDYISLIHRPNRNIYIVVVTLIMSLPFLYQLFIKRFKRIITLPSIAIILCILIAASPHLLTLFSVMHGYAATGMTALFIAYVLNDREYSNKLICTTFALYLISSIFVDIHHWYESYKSGLYGLNMSNEIIRQTTNKPKNVYIIIIDDGYTKYSSFCVIPSDALGWGRAVQHYNGYIYPQQFNDTTIMRSDAHMINTIKQKAITNGYDAVWLVEGKHACVIK